jgi:competence protein ComEC
MTSSKILLYFCLSFIAGVSLNKVPQLFMLGFLIAGLIFISVLFKYKKIVVIGFCILFLVLGIYRRQPVINDGLNKEAVLIGTVSEEPDIGENSQKIAIKAGENPEGKHSASYGARILVTTGRYPEYKYGDKLKITGKLEPPAEDINGFNYKNYLAKDGIFSIMSFPKIELIDRGFGNPIMKALFHFKNKFKEISRSYISPPEVGVLEALVFGQEEGISKEWREKFNLTGTRHIAAVSGMNITIIASLILTLFLSLGLWRQQAFYLSIALLVLYILMIGAPASAVRAGVMAGIFLFAQKSGRMSQGQGAVIFAASFMLALNPLLLRFDIGFQLSFLAIMGIIYLQPIFSDWLGRIPDYKIFPLRAVIAATLSAQVFTLPVLIYNFGYVSLVSLPANILIVPFLAPITILIFIFGLSGMIFSFLGWIFSFPAWLAINYLTKVIDIFSKIPLNVFKIENLHWVWLAVFYLILGLFIWRWQEKEKLKFLKY